MVTTFLHSSDNNTFETRKDTSIMEYTITVVTNTGYEYPVMALCDTVEQANNLASKIVRDVKRWSAADVAVTASVAKGFTHPKEKRANNE